MQKKRRREQESDVERAKTKIFWVNLFPSLWQKSLNKMEKPTRRFMHNFFNEYACIYDKIHHNSTFWCQRHFNADVYSVCVMPLQLRQTFQLKCEFSVFSSSSLFSYFLNARIHMQMYDRTKRASHKRVESRRKALCMQ